MLIPSTYSWLLACLLLLIYSFDILDFVELLPVNPFAGTGIILLGIILFLVIVTLHSTGVLLDKRPDLIKVTTIIGMLGSSVMIIIFVVMIEVSILLIISLTLLALFFSILLTSSAVMFAGIIPLKKRGRLYSYAIFAFILLTLLSIIAGGIISSRFNSNELLSNSFVSVLAFTGFLGLILSIVFLILTRKMSISWVNDKWPTKFRKIVGRRSVRAYMAAHLLLYGMLGLTIASFSQIGQEFDFEWIIDLGGMGIFDLPVNKVFWFTVLLGDLALILISGYLADRVGRKTLIVFAIYGIVFSALFFGLEQTANSFLLSALVIGFSFALIHPTLDSTIWADLSPRDGLGRYHALGFISLAAGLGIGFYLGHWVFIPSMSKIVIISYVLVVLAIIAALPLFWVADSFHPLDFRLLIVISQGGLPVFHHTFNKKLEMTVELPLLSGALIAVSSFMSETMKDKGDLNLVQHGNNFILTEEKEGLSVALFSNKQDPELQSALRTFLDEFYNEYGDTAVTWNGTPNLFDGAVDIAEKVFGHMAPTTDLVE